MDTKLQNTENEKMKARMFMHPHWDKVGHLSVDDIKEELITGYKTGKPFSPHNYHFFEPTIKADRVLDFGCGIGRNFANLKRHSRELVAFDFPAMINACRTHGDCSDVTLISDWDAIADQHFDVVIATLVFQHIENEDILHHIIDSLADICDFLYLSTRCWADGEGNPNVYNAIQKTGKFEYRKGTVSEQEAGKFLFPDETHMELLLRNHNAAMHSAGNAELFGLNEQHYKTSDLKLNITLTQLFTPNYDHWAFKVLENKKRYCDTYGYKFHYRRGVYEHAQERHPSWHRIPLLLELFEEDDTDWVFWSDIDSLIMRYDVRLEGLIDEFSEKDLIVPNQGAGLFLGDLVPECLCFGQFFIRKTDWSRQFLEEVWKFPERAGMKSYLQKESWEQEAVNYIYKHNLVDFASHSAIVPNRLFNSFYHTQYIDRDFLIHFAGEEARGKGRREKLIDNYLRKVLCDHFAT